MGKSLRDSVSALLTGPCCVTQLPPWEGLVLLPLVGRILPGIGLSPHTEVQSLYSGFAVQRLFLLYKIQANRGPNLSFGFGSATKATVTWKHFDEAITEWCILHFVTLLCTKIFWITFSDFSTSRYSDLSKGANIKPFARDFSGTWLKF